MDERQVDLREREKDFAAAKAFVSKKAKGKKNSGLDESTPLSGETVATIGDRKMSMEKPTATEPVVAPTPSDPKADADADADVKQQRGERKKEKKPKKPTKAERQ